MVKKKQNTKKGGASLGFFGLLGHYLGTLNNSKFFSGVIMIFMNIGSKYISIEFSKSQEQYLKNSIGRQLLIFSICWMGSRDILIALALTAIFNVLANHLFNEDSKFCIVPMKYRNYENILDLNGDGKVTEDELKKAKDLIKKADVKEKRREHLKMLNNFKLSV